MRSARGFTIIELMVVLSVIAILMTLVLWAINSSRASGRDTGRQQIMTGMQSSLERYYADNKSYVNGGTRWDWLLWLMCTHGAYTPGTLCVADPIGAAGPPVIYMPTVPKDPADNGTNCHTPTAGGEDPWCPCAASPCTRATATRPAYYYEAPGIAHKGITSPCVTSVPWPQSYQLVLEKESGGVAFYCSP